MTQSRTVLILGAGVSGLSCGILLLQAGYEVTIWAKDVPPNTTSDVAAALWYPYLCNPRDKAITWSKHTHDFLNAHALGDSRSGCIMRSFTELFETQVDEPWWAPAVDSYRRPSPEELPAGYVDGYQTDVVLMDSELYMQWLLNWFLELGGTVELKVLTSFDEALAEQPLVINCTGLGSRELCGDDRVYPVRGQIVKVALNDYDRIVVGEPQADGLSMIAPRITDVVLGGTTQANNWNLEVDPQDTKDILRKAASLSPAFSDPDILDIRVGLRPARDEVRLEIEEFDNGAVIHNYGHGGAGYTLSWGCAQDVLELVAGQMPA
ncbi:MAG: FAD-binding oxidoreductase [Actinomycetales bacterium]|nr:FAD-binding oxidoreductase [Actinomycetales bacterium]